MDVFSPQAEVCSGTVAEVIQSVVNGADGCVFCFGQVKLGKLLRWREIKQQHLSTKKALNAFSRQCLEPSIGLSVQWGESKNGKLEERNGECVCVWGGGQGKVPDLNFTL